MSRLARVSIVMLGLAVLAQIVMIFVSACIYVAVKGEPEIAELSPIIGAVLWTNLVGWLAFISGGVMVIITAIRHKPVPGAFTAVTIALVVAFAFLQAFAPFFGSLLGALVS